MSLPGTPEPGTGDLSAPRLPLDMHRFGPGPPFVARLRKALCEPSLQDCIAWRKGGTVVAIHEPRFCQQVLGGRLFRTSKMASFVRNLNKHRFHKLLSFDVAKASPHTGLIARGGTAASVDPIAEDGVASTMTPWLFFMNPLFVETDPCFALQVQMLQPGIRADVIIDTPVVSGGGAWQSGLHRCRSAWRHFVRASPRMRACLWICDERWMALCGCESAQPL